jgi:uncharacterized protein (DUF1499 family)
MLGYIVVCCAVGMLGYVRLAPSQIARWHQPIDAAQDKDLPSGAVRVVTTGSGAFDVLETTLKEMERTTLLGGSSKDAHVTYVTRSKWFGFPDYTTLEQSGDTVKMFGRLRFGRKDFGVNAARLQKLVSALK